MTKNSAGTKSKRSVKAKKTSEGGFYFGLFKGFTMMEVGM
jgi:hypothetical protein